MVDSIIKPTEVIGIADGKGSFLRDTDKHSELIKKGELGIIQKRMESK